MSRRAKFLAGTCAGTLALILVLATATSAQTAPAGDVASTASASRTDVRTPRARITKVRAGFEGKFKVGAWTPFEITVRAGEEPLEGEVELIVLDGDAVPSRVRSESALKLSPGQEGSLTLYAKVGQLRGSVLAQVRSGDAVLASRELSTEVGAELDGILPSSQELILAVGVAVASDDLVATGSRTTTVAELESLDALPEAWWGLEGVDAILLATGADEIGPKLAAAQRRIAALERWVGMGGKLVISAGRHAEAALGEHSPLAKLVPGKLDPASPRVPLRQLTSLETYVQASDPLPPVVGPPLQVPKLIETRGRIEAFAGNRTTDLPLVVRAPFGFGEVVLITFDLERTPLVGWSEKPQLYDKLLERQRSSAIPREARGTGQVTTLGFVDIAGQLRGALDQFPGVQFVPFWLVVALVLGYIACIGPLDYFVVKRLLGRMEATWITSALLMAAFSVGGYLLANGLKGRELRVNQVDIVDWDAESRLVRGTTWATLFSPRIDVYDLSVTPRAGSVLPEAPQPLVSWLGLPGTGFGGMDAAAGNLPLFTEPYDFSPGLDRLRRVPIAVWSSKAFVARWMSEQKPGVEAELTNRRKLVGTLTSRLDMPLEDCVLIYDRWAYPLRTLQPGREIRLEREVDPQTVDTYLRHVTVQGDRNVTVPYDRASFDVARIVEIMAAHEMAGGEAYTGLSNASPGFIDCSRLVRDGRAVLVGRSKQPAVQWNRGEEPLLDPQGRNWTIFRYVFPVAADGDSEPTP